MDFIGANSAYPSADIVLFGAPYDSTTSFRPGTRFGPAAMLPMAVATSIDALAVGVSYSFYLNWGQLWLAIAAIGVITFLMSAIAVKLGSIFGARHKTIAERLGGVILILMGTKILLEGLGFWF